MVSVYVGCGVVIVCPFVCVCLEYHVFGRCVVGGVLCCFLVTWSFVVLSCWRVGFSTGCG